MKSKNSPILYGIQFTGPSRKNIWWNADGPFGSRVLTFTDINEAFEWSALRTSLWPHCKYEVKEYKPTPTKKKRSIDNWEERFWSQVIP